MVARQSFRPGLWASYAGCLVFASPIFLFAFLPIALAMYHCSPRRTRNLTLLVLSLIFYGWGEHEWVLVMLASIVFNWLGALAIGRWRERRHIGLILGGIVAVNITALACFKYEAFMVGNLSVLLEALGLQALPPVESHLPLGISFFTFHAISYVVDVRRGQSRALANPLDTALYFALFPQLIAGPIIRYHYIEEQLRERSAALVDVAAGVERFVTGLAKKVLIANVAGRCADNIFELAPTELGFGTAWVGVIAYAIQIYFDFSGYSDMAIGLGRMFGFRFPENFNYPYASRSLTEFWRRWHISLSSWFRDYVYVPLGGNRVSARRTYVNLVSVFLLCGLWHGASWNFVIWGALHGLFLVLERSAFSRVLGAAPRVLQHGYTLLVVCVGWVLFRAPDLGAAGRFLWAMSGAAGGAPASHRVTLFVTPAVLVAGVLAGAFATPALRTWAEAIVAPARAEAMRRWLGVPVMALLLTLSASHLATSSYNPFIYFRF
jgi:alginate O-acetyltransferase complex protein AlgI